MAPDAPTTPTGPYRAYQLPSDPKRATQALTAALDAYTYLEGHLPATVLLHPETPLSSLAPAEGVVLERHRVIPRGLAYLGPSTLLGGAQ